jgi:hypothetical protein
MISPVCQRRSLELFTVPNTLRYSLCYVYLFIPKNSDVFHHLTSPIIAPGISNTREGVIRPGNHLVTNSEECILPGHFVLFGNNISFACQGVSPQLKILIRVFHIETQCCD